MGEDDGNRLNVGKSRGRSGTFCCRYWEHWGGLSKEQQDLICFGKLALEE